MIMVVLIPMVWRETRKAKWSSTAIIDVSYNSYSELKQRSSSAFYMSTSKKIDIFSTNRKLQNGYNFCIISYNLLFIIMISPLCLDRILWIQNDIVSYRQGKEGKLSWRQNNDAFPPFRDKVYSIQIPSCDVPREQKNAEPGNKNLLQYEAWTRTILDLNLR